MRICSQSDRGRGREEKLVGLKVEVDHDRAASIMSASTTTFTQNERVLCYHGPMIYEAKILKIDNWDEANTKTGTVGPHFFVHYKGWKQTRVSVTLRSMMRKFLCLRSIVGGTNGSLLLGC